MSSPSGRPSDWEELKLISASHSIDLWVGTLSAERQSANWRHGEALLLLEAPIHQQL